MAFKRIPSFNPEKHTDIILGGDYGTGQIRRSKVKDTRKEETQGSGYEGCEESPSSQSGEESGNESRSHEEIRKTIGFHTSKSGRWERLKKGVHPPESGPVVRCPKCGGLTRLPCFVCYIRGESDEVPS